MFTATMIAKPGMLDPVLAGSIQSAWGGSELRWLSAAEAAEFDIPAMPDNRWAVWEELQKLSVDLVVQPTEGRKKSVLVADMDSTMIAQELSLIHI